MEQGPQPIQECCQLQKNQIQVFKRTTRPTQIHSISSSVDYLCETKISMSIIVRAPWLQGISPSMDLRSTSKHFATQNYFVRRLGSYPTRSIPCDTVCIAFASLVSMAFLNAGTSMHNGPIISHS